MTAVAVEWFKWPATPYRLTPMKRLGVDNQGTWLFAPKGTVTAYAVTGPVSLPVNFLTLVPAGVHWWMCTWMWGNPEINIDLYVDIIHPPTWISDGCLHVVDLDLDVIRYQDGSVLVDDEDEFAEHTISLNYPPALVSSARAAAAAVLDAVALGRHPFTAVPDQWLETVAAQPAIETA